MSERGFRDLLKALGESIEHAARSPSPTAYIEGVADYNAVIDAVNAKDQRAAELMEMLKWAREHIAPPMKSGFYSPEEYSDAMQEFDEKCAECARLLQEHPKVADGIRSVITSHIKEDEHA